MTPERFLSRIAKLPNGCWRYGRTRTGYYGGAVVNDKHGQAHRHAYEILVGPIPAGLLLRHTCNEPSCCNPDHLIPGTHTENTADVLRKGRAKGGFRSRPLDYPPK